jgi:hypothetical protein
MNLAVVILNWNETEDTASCLRSVRAWSPDASIWVVDNGSRPPGAEPIRSAFPDVHVISSPVNRGFAGGCNLGIKAAVKHGADAVLLLNNDATIDAAGVGALVATLAADPSVGIVGPLIRDDTDHFTAGGRDIAHHWVTHVRLQEPPPAVFDVDYVPGTIALVRTSLFETIGLLDEDYFFGGEMADLCLRARARGLRSVTEPAATGTHRLARSSGLRPVLHSYYIIRNRFLYLRKHHQGERARLSARWAARGFAAAIAAFGRGDRQRARAVALGVVDGLRGRFGGRNELIAR